MEIKENIWRLGKRRKAKYERRTMGTQLISPSPAIKRAIPCYYPVIQLVITHHAVA
jgi:hypothetical protein